MRKIICILLLTALLMSTLAACNAPDDASADAFETTLSDALGIVPTDSSADTTAAPIETTAPIIYHGSISCADNMNLSEIKVDFYKIM